VEELAEVLAELLEDLNPDVAASCEFILCLFKQCNRWDADAFVVFMN